MKNIWKVLPALRKTYQSGHAGFQMKEGRGAWKVHVHVVNFSSRSAMYAGSAESSLGPGSELRTDGPAFVPKRALVLTKFSRYEFEKRRHADLTEEELVKDLEARGSDYNSLLHHHKIHTKNRELVVSTLKQKGIETRLVDRFEYTDANIDWADVIFTTGGDGTFLMAASKIYSRDKPVIGINSDPSRSIGYLCLPGHCTENFPLALERLLTGRFQWMWRQRMRVTLKGEHAFDPPVELHDQQLQYPEYRFLDCWQEQHLRRDSTPTPHPTGDDASRVLPVRSLNEVFVGETLSSRVSYYELSIDGSPRVKLKSSGLTVCTGTGSTSWSFNINKVTPQCVQRILDIVGVETGTVFPTKDQQLIEKITTKFNNSLIFDPSKCLMAYTIRDPVVFGTDFSSKPRGFAKRIEVKSRMFDACLVIDGGLSFVFNDGATAIFEMHEDDALRTVQFAD
ncbi:NAD kinase 2, mitochondrial-like isoform X2 [Ornithodoros turicata]|uniref:NAD kinase 2, mitochondrial-like isoform X2 n=1 Tax=Ornithodoros turicata TaxID=34597 RepID=UPI003139079D